MKCYRISWFEEFECLGGDCEETCCRGWVIPLDENDINRLKKERGRLGLSLFWATAGWTRDKFNKGSGKCPFWGDDGLCRLQKSKGHDFIPWTCRSFPRFYRNYGDFEESCLDLSCIGAARLFMRHLHDKGLIWEEAEPVTRLCTTNDDKPYLDYLIDQRSQMMEAADRGLTGDLARILVSFAGKLQDSFAAGNTETAQKLSFAEYCKDWQNESSDVVFPMRAGALNAFLHTSLCHPRLMETSPALYKMLAKARKVTEEFLGNEEGWQQAVTAFMAENPLLADTLSAYYSYYLFQYFLRTYETYSFRRQIILGLCHTNMILLLSYSAKDATSEGLAMIIARYNRRAYFNDIIQDAMYKEAVKGISHPVTTRIYPSASVYRQVYELTDAVSPLEGDCGKICAGVCCRAEAFDSSRGSCIYLLPGEEKVFEEPPKGLKLIREDSREHDLPASWGGTVTTAQCDGPENCVRGCRPMQCRTYPLAPHINKKGELELIYSDAETPYTCPLIYEKKELSDDFLKNTYEAWEILTGYAAIRDLVVMDSNKRNRYWKKITTVCTKEQMDIMHKK